MYSPRLSNGNVSCLGPLFVNEEKAETETGQRRFSIDVQHFSLSSGERAGVRASIEPFSCISFSPIHRAQHCRRREKSFAKLNQ